MRAYDLSPFYRSTIGFDRMLDLLEASRRPQAPEEAWPPYDIERLSEDRFRITMAVAGFAEDELNIVAEPNALLIEGRKADDDSGRNYLHRGISQRAFRRQFDLADFVVVAGATYENGLLSVDLRQEIPEAMKPRRIEIGAASATKAAKREPSRVQAVEAVA